MSQFRFQSGKTTFIQYLLSLILYILVSELVRNLLGYLFFPANLITNIQRSALCLFAIFIINSQAYPYLNSFAPWSSNPMRRFTLQSVVMAFVIPFLVMLSYVGFQYIRFRFLQANVFVSYSLTAIDYFLFVVIIELNVIADLWRYYQQQWESGRIQQATFEKEKAQFNLELLRNQINPHFLFNNLNTLSALIYDSQDKAAGFLRQLSQVYRNILEYRNRETVTLEEELAFFDSYTQLLGIRFQDMLFISIDINPAGLSRKMIPLTLQMLIENAIKHNVVSKNQPLTVTIRTENDFLIVSNPVQKKESLEYSSGLGLKIIRQRYEYLSELPFEVISSPDLFMLKIPLL